MPYIYYARRGRYLFTNLLVMSALKHYSDEDLAELMKMAISESSDSDYEAAFTDFFQRHKSWVMFLCRKFSGKYSQIQNLPEEIFNEFFFQFRSKISSFDASRSQAQRPLLAWIKKVLLNLALDMTSNYQKRRNGEVLLSSEQWQEQDADHCEEDEVVSDEPPSSAEKQAYKTAFALQSDRNQGIIIEYYNRKPVNRSQRNAKGVYNEIGAMFDTTGESVKKIISRFHESVLKTLTPQ